MINAPRSLPEARTPYRARSFLLDDKQGAITAPDSIARLNYARVIVFFRNGELVGWRQIVVIHK
jgi:hypothetical protein